MKKEPDAKKYFRKWIGSYEFINRVYRYCLWLGETAPAELKGMPECLKIVEKVTKYRLGSKSGTTRRLASKPTRFNRENIPRSSYLVIPEVSSEKRKYIPIGFISPDIMPSNLVKVVEDANLYHFGILTSILHNAWMRQTGGRLKSDYRYSQDIVYNNFPWPEVDDKEKAKIEELSREILAVREKYQESGLADLYDPLTMPPDLLKAHEKLDKAVLRLYGLPASAGEREIVEHLLKLYKEKSRKAEEGERRLGWSEHLAVFLNGGAISLWIIPQVRRAAKRNSAAVFDRESFKSRR